MSVTAIGISILIAIVSLFVFFIRHLFSFWKRRGIPYEAPTFPHGNLKSSCHVSRVIKDNYLKFKTSGPFGSFFWNLRPAVILHDPELIKNVLLKDFHNFPERGLFQNEQDDPISGGLFRLDECKWKPFRGQVSPSFSGIRMKDMFLTIVLVGHKLLEVFETIAQPDDSVIEMSEIIARYAVDINGTCVFGIDCKSLGDRNGEFFSMTKNILNLKRHSKFVSGLISSFPKFAQKLRMRIIHKDIHDFFLRLVRDTVEFREKNSIHRNDFLNLMIELKNSEVGLSLEQITGQSFAFFVAGFKNSSAAIEFTLFELAINQDIQDQLRDEIKEKLEKYQEELSFECMMEMRYLKKVVKESLRKYPVVPFLMRLTKNDYQTSHPKYIIPKGTTVIIPIEAIQNDPEIYPEPETFDPERFQPEEIKNRHLCSWLPFGDGPRHCIGLRFAKMQIYVPLILLLRRYKFHYCKETPYPLEFDPKIQILNSKGGISLRVERI